MEIVGGIATIVGTIVAIVSFVHQIRQHRRKNTHLGISGERPQIPESVANAVKALSDPDPKAREGAISTLLNHSHPSATEALAKASEDPLLEYSDDVRIGASFALSEKPDGRKDKRIVPGLRLALQSKDTEVRRKAAACLGAVGMTVDEAVEVLSKAFQVEENDNVRISVMMALGRTNNSLSVPTLASGLNDNVGRVREAALDGLGMMGDPSMTSVIVRILRTDSWDVAQRAAATALGRIGTPEAKDELYNAFHDEQNPVGSEARRAIVGALGTYGDESDLERLKRMVNWAAYSRYRQDIQTAMRRIETRLKQQG